MLEPGQPLASGLKDFCDEVGNHGLCQVVIVIAARLCGHAWRIIDLSRCGRVHRQSRESTTHRSPHSRATGVDRTFAPCPSHDDRSLVPL